jgi:hypothetical protein
MRTLFFSLFIIIPSLLLAQDGLEGIIVEKYYVSTAEDAKAKNKSGDLPEGSVTYRIFVDLKPGFRFQAAYGTAEHPLKITSTEKFFNHDGAGTTHPNILPGRTLSQDVSLLDSWLSVGAASEFHLGIPRMYDVTTDASATPFKEGFLENKERKRDFSLRQRDGLVTAATLPYPTFFQMDSCLKFLGRSTSGDSIVVQDGAWASMGKGSVGADSLTTNTVLIAQLTTKGQLSFELNLMIADTHGNSHKYVARNAVGREKTHPDLIYRSEKVITKKRKKNNKKAS